MLLSKVTGGARVTLNVKSRRNIIHPNYEGWQSSIKLPLPLGRGRDWPLERAQWPPGAEF